MLFSVVIGKLFRRDAQFDRLGLPGLQLNAPEGTQTADGLIHRALALVRVHLGNFRAGAVPRILHLERNLNILGGTRRSLLNVEMAEFETRITEPEAEC